jgi:hypothetical protein
VEGGDRLIGASPLARPGVRVRLPFRPLVRPAATLR